MFENWQKLVSTEKIFILFLRISILLEIKQNEKYPYAYWKVLSFGLATAPKVFTSLMKPILFLCHHQGLCIVIYLDDILVLICSKQVGKRAHLFLCSLLVHLGLYINFSNSYLCLSQSLLSWDYVGILSACQYLYLLIS